MFLWKAFLEMSSHEEAADMVNYHKENPASLYGKPLSFYLSKTLLVIEVRPEMFLTKVSSGGWLRSARCHHQKDLHSTNRQERPNDQVMERHSREDNIQHSQVVFFSNLPREEDKKKELLTIAGRFGIVEKHLFLTDQVCFFPVLPSASSVLHHGSSHRRFCCRLGLDPHE